MRNHGGSGLARAPPSSSYSELRIPHSALVRRRLSRSVALPQRGVEVLAEVVEQLPALLADVPGRPECLLVGGDRQHLPDEEVVIAERHALDHAALQVADAL